MHHSSRALNFNGVVVEELLYSKKIHIVRAADLNKKNRQLSTVNFLLDDFPKMCVSVSLEKDDIPKECLLLLWVFLA